MLASEPIAPMYTSFPLRAAFFGLCLLAGSSTSGEEPGRDAAFFESKIRPLLVQRCYECHARTAKHREGGLAVDSRAGLMAGGETGAAIVPGKPEESLLVLAVKYDGDVQMPPVGKLPAEEIALLSEWVRRGAPMPEDGVTEMKRKGIDFETGRKFWSFQPPKASPPPTVKDTQWSRKAIDPFVLAAMERRGLEPSPRADARTLIRRATFDLIGLPPEPEEVEQFASDPSPEAYARLVDRLLASPHYGERWGRYWLDFSRYADGNTTSLEVRGQAWLYRDWIVQALNQDLPYDQFVLKQLAADKLLGAQPADLAALGFLATGPEYFKELKLAPSVIQGIVADEWEERIDAIGRTFLGLSLACARCHDHKFDPISTDDYYALAGVLASSRLVDRFVVSEAEAGAVNKAVRQVQAIEAEIKRHQESQKLSDEARDKAAWLAEQKAAIERDTPRFHSALAHALDDAALHVLPAGPDNTKLEYKPGEALDLQIHIRGNPAKLGAKTPRRFLTVLSPTSPEPFKQGSGRLELAQSLVSTAAPLSARVMVNRVWKLHFGRGLVETPSDFGAQGSRPSHPELLDDLTSRFIAGGWSLKWLHREIMLSAAYQQASASHPAKVAVDPDSKLLWRMSRRRLDIEAWRDAVLSVCGQLDRQIGGPSVSLTSRGNHRRTLYGKIDRADVEDMLRLHDFPDPSTHSPDREPTTTALQQLFVLNSPFMADKSEVLARRLLAADKPAADELVRRAYRQLFARTPRESEQQLGVAFLASRSVGGDLSIDAVRQYTQALLGSNEFLFVD